MLVSLVWMLPLSLEAQNTANPSATPPAPALSDPSTPSEEHSETSPDPPFVLPDDKDITRPLRRVLSVEPDPESVLDSDEPLSPLERMIDTYIREGKQALEKGDTVQGVQRFNLAFALIQQMPNNRRQEEALFTLSYTLFKIPHWERFKHYGEMYMHHPLATTFRKRLFTACLEETNNHIAILEIEPLPHAALLVVDEVPILELGFHRQHIPVSEGKHSIKATMSGRTELVEVMVKAGELRYVAFHTLLPPVRGAVPRDTWIAAVKVTYVKKKKTWRGETGYDKQITARTDDTPDQYPPNIAFPISALVNETFKHMPLFPGGWHPEPEIPPPSQLRWGVSGSLAGAGLVSLAAGLGFLVSSHTTQTHLEGIRAGMAYTGQTEANYCLGKEDNPYCKAMRDLSDTLHRKKMWSTSLLIGGGALLVGGVMTAILWPAPSPQVLALGKPSKERGTLFAWNLAPRVEPDHYGFLLQGTY